MNNLSIYFSLLFLPFFLYAGNDAKVDIFYFVDHNHTYNIENILPKKEKLFTQRLTSQDAEFPENSTVWIKIDTTNVGDHNSEPIIKFLDIRLDRVDVYLNDGMLLYSMGDRVPFANRPHADAQIAIDLPAKAHSENTIYLKFTNEDKMELSYAVYDKAGYAEDMVFKKVMHAFFFGALLIMLIYNIVLYLFIWEKTFLVYILYHITLMFVMLYYNGLVSQYYDADSYDINGGNVPVVLSYLAVILAIQFLRYFLNLKDYTPKMDRWLLFFIYLNVLLLVLAPMGIVPKGIASINMIFLSVFLLYVSWYHSFVLKRKIALFYLLGWVVMLVAIIITGLLSFGYVERNDFTAYIFQMGIVIEITLLSMGLAYRYKSNQDELREKTQVLHEQSKLAAMGEMMRHIAHQWRQPLSEINSVAMKIETEHRRNTLDDASLDRNIEQIENITEHMSKTIQDFNSYFKSDKAKTRTTLEAVVDKALGLVMGGLSKNDIHIDKAVEVAETVEIVDGELVQVLLVLLNNARDALKASDVPEKWIKIRIAKENSKHLIEVEDSAGGIEKRNLDKVFEPYFTTKFEAQGVGIGLYMSKMIVEESLGGSLSVINGSHGAKFTVVL